MQHEIVMILGLLKKQAVLKFLDITSSTDFTVE